MPRQTTADVADTVEDRPLAGYATLTSAFWAVFAAFVLVAGRRLPHRTSTGDLVRIALASYKMSRVVAKEDVALSVSPSFSAISVTVPDLPRSRPTTRPRVLSKNRSSSFVVFIRPSPSANIHSQR